MEYFPPLPRLFNSPSCLDSNTCSILGRSFETRNESQGRQSTPPRYPPLSESLTGSVPNRLGTHPFTLASIPKFRKTAILMHFPGQQAALAILWHQKRSTEKVTYFPWARLAFFSNRCLN